ncbi:MAG: hypothetical protein RBS68_14735 [Anaerolineales bacterium]|jgi:hypothetical protein|nr:hypothetical protein [Anaerolineales bacterium]
MTNPESNSHFIETALPELETYLLSETLYWPLGGSLPRLTPGALLLALRQAEALNPPAARKWRQQLDLISAKRRTAWEQKARSELVNRLRLWGESVAEWQPAASERRADYSGQVRSRVILQLLLHEVNAPAQQAVLDGLDAFLRANLKPAPFLWDAQLAETFPKDEFWFLYGKLN